MKEEKKEEEEEEVTEAPIVVDREVGFRVLENCRTTVEELEEVIYGQVKVQDQQQDRVSH